MNKNLTEHKEKLDEATIAEIEKAISEAKTLESSTDVEAIKSKSQALSNASMKIGQAMYGKGSSNQSGKSEEPATAETTEKEKEKEK